MVELLQRVGSRVRRLRSERGWTLRRLAEQANLSVRFVSQLESGKGNISIVRLDGVAKALDVALSELVAEEAMSHPPMLALLGLRGAGKSTLGPQLASRLGMTFVELDDRIEETAGLSLTEIFSLHGEAYYRRLVAQCLAELVAGETRCVVALPGGIVHDDEAFTLVRRHATTVWLKAKPEDHMKRVLAQGDRRPIAGSTDAMAELRAILATREPFYAQANVTVDTSEEGKRTLGVLLEELGGQGWREKGGKRKS